MEFASSWVHMREKKAPVGGGSPGLTGKRPIGDFHRTQAPTGTLSTSTSSLQSAAAFLRGTSKDPACLPGAHDASWWNPSDVGPLETRYLKQPKQRGELNTAGGLPTPNGGWRLFYFFFLFEKSCSVVSSVFRSYGVLF